MNARGAVWDVVRLGEVCEIRSGGTPSRSEARFWNGSIPWVKTGEINYRPIRATEECITPEGLQNSAAKLCPPGTLLMAMYGQGATRGRVAFLEIEAATNQACAAFLPSHRLDRRFLYAFFRFAHGRIRDMGHGANQKNLSIDILKAIEIPLPPLSLQRSIAEVVSRMQAAVELQERRAELTREAFQSTLQALLSRAVQLDPEVEA